MSSNFTQLLNRADYAVRAALAAAPRRGDGLETAAQGRAYGERYMRAYHGQRMAMDSEAMNPVNEITQYCKDNFSRKDVETLIGALRSLIRDEAGVLSSFEGKSDPAMDQAASNFDAIFSDIARIKIL